MILAAREISTLQQFLIDAAKRYVVPRTGSVDDARDLLASAAALDYVMVLASEHGDESIDDTCAIAGSVRETVARAASAALDFTQTIVSDAPDVRADFLGRHLIHGGIFDALRVLHARGALCDGNVTFRILTITSDLRERARD